MTYTPYQIQNILIENAKQGIVIIYHYIIYLFYFYIYLFYYYLLLFLFNRNCPVTLTGWDWPVTLEIGSKNFLNFIAELQNPKGPVRHVNPFHLDCKTIFSRIFQIFALYFSIFKAWSWLSCKVHILFYIKNNQSNTKYKKNRINELIKINNLGSKKVSL